MAMEHYEEKILPPLRKVSDWASYIQMWSSAVVVLIVWLRIYCIQSGGNSSDVVDYL